MPRQARQKSLTGIYHVMMRGIDRATIFHDDEDCEKFLDVMRACRAPLSVRAQSGDGERQGQSPDGWAKYYAYCLMGNHVHLLLQEGDEPIEQIIKRIGVRYASYYNWKYQRSGHLFQDRFRSAPVDDDRYFLAVFRYIALNPVKAGLAKQVGDYPWGSYRPVGVRGISDVSIREGILGQSLSPGFAVTEGQSQDDWGAVTGGQSLTAATPLVSPLPIDITPEQLDTFIRSEQPNLHPFPERISDREAEAILLRVAGLRQATEFRHLPKEKQIMLFSVLQEENLSIHQMARLTGIAKSNIARYLG